MPARGISLEKKSEKKFEKCRTKFRNGLTPSNCLAKLGEKMNGAEKVGSDLNPSKRPDKSWKQSESLKFEPLPRFRAFFYRGSHSFRRVSAFVFRGGLEKISPSLTFFRLFSSSISDFVSEVVCVAAGRCRLFLMLSPTCFFQHALARKQSTGHVLTQDI